MFFSKHSTPSSSDNELSSISKGRLKTTYSDSSPYHGSRQMLSQRSKSPERKRKRSPRRSKSPIRSRNSNLKRSISPHRRRPYRRTLDGDQSRRLKSPIYRKKQPGSMALAIQNGQNGSSRRQNLRTPSSSDEEKPFRRKTPDQENSKSIAIRSRKQRLRTPSSSDENDVKPKSRQESPEYSRRQPRVSANLNDRESNNTSSRMNSKPPLKRLKTPESSDNEPGIAKMRLRTPDSETSVENNAYFGMPADISTSLLSKKEKRQQRFSSNLPTSSTIKLTNDIPKKKKMLLRRKKTPTNSTIIQSQKRENESNDAIQINEDDEKEERVPIHKRLGHSSGSVSIKDRLGKTKEEDSESETSKTEDATSKNSTCFQWNFTGDCNFYFEQLKIEKSYNLKNFEKNFSDLKTAVNLDTIVTNVLTLATRAKIIVHQIAQDLTRKIYHQINNFLSHLNLRLTKLFRRDISLLSK